MNNGLRRNLQSAEQSNLLLFWAASGSLTIPVDYNYDCGANFAKKHFDQKIKIKNVCSSDTSITVVNNVMNWICMHIRYIELVRREWRSLSFTWDDAITLFSSLTRGSTWWAFLWRTARPFGSSKLFRNDIKMHFWNFTGDLPVRRNSTNICWLAGSIKRTPTVNYFLYS